MSTKPRPLTSLAAVVFAVVALGHLLRAVFGLDLVIGEQSIPISVSVVAAIVAGGLSLGIRRESRGS